MGKIYVVKVTTLKHGTVISMMISTHQSSLYTQAGCRCDDESTVLFTPFLGTANA